MANVFLREPHEYRRNLNVVPEYIRDATLFLHKATGKSIEECKSFVIAEVKGNVNDRETFILSRDHDRNQDRREVVVTYTDYIQDAVDKNRVLSPTLVTYRSEEEQPSLLSKYIAGNIVKRGKAKKQMFDAKTAGNLTLQMYYNLTQASFKIKNNGLSGGHSSPYSPLYNKSTHSSLTSGCRVTTSYGNATAERFLSGNRHYWSPDVALSNLVNTVNQVDQDKIEQVMVKYGLAYPSAQDILDMVHRCSKHYWAWDRAPKGKREAIVRFINGLNPLERACILYNGDAFSLTMLNEVFFKDFVLSMATLETAPTLSVEEADGFIKQLDGDQKILVNLLTSHLTQGRPIKEFRESKVETYLIYGASAKNILGVLDSHADFIEAFWRTDALPGSIAAIPSIVRYSVVGSDTDSCLFSTDNFVEWIRGTETIDRKPLGGSASSMNVSQSLLEDPDKAGDVMAYFLTQLIAHNLAIMSANMGIPEKHIHRISMKNEYAFPAFCPTSIAKHYYAYKSAQEGVLMSEFELEKKGVNLKSSNSPPAIIEGAEQLICEVLDAGVSRQRLSALDVLAKVAEVERGIITSLKEGKAEFAITGQIKNPEAYANPDVSPYAHHLLWQECFAHRYGQAPALPYATYRFSTTLDNKTKLNAWLETLSCNTTRGKITEYLASRNRDKLPSILVPAEIVASVGLPIEIQSAINFRKAVYDIMTPYYLVLESIGLFVVDENYEHLVSDSY